MHSIITQNKGKQNLNQKPRTIICSVQLILYVMAYNLFHYQNVMETFLRLWVNLPFVLLSVVLLSFNVLLLFSTSFLACSRLSLLSSKNRKYIPYIEYKI